MQTNCGAAAIKKMTYKELGLKCIKCGKPISEAMKGIHCYDCFFSGEKFKVK